ncbi:MAG TPA: CAP domain-containing protein [Phycisphaerae bacterium]|nr:CAP domain-containing protein [Phycisphaerae bacterium]
MQKRDRQGRRRKRPAGRRPSLRAWGIEALEERLLLSASDPSGAEQELLWLLNRVRTDPADELPKLLGSHDPNVQQALGYFQVDQNLLAQQWTTLTAVQPLAWNANLAAAAAIHTQAMAAQDTQAHQLPGENPPDQRINNAGYTFSSAGENVYAYAFSPFHAHTAFAIDWGAGPGTTGGIQDPPGHRQTMMDGDYRDVGISWMAQASTLADGSTPTTGPFLTTEDFAAPAMAEDPALVGTVYTDANHDGAYTAGEGVGGVTVTAVGTGTEGTFAATTLTAGGYELTLPDGDYTVTFSGPTIPTNVLGTTFTVHVADQNVLQDLETGTIIAGGSGNSPVLGKVEAWQNWPVALLGPERVTGWASDLDTPNAGQDSVMVELVVDGVAGTPVAASIPRTDLVAAVGSADHGFSLSIPVLGAGTHTVAVVAMNYPGDEPVVLGSRTVTVSGSPIGNVDRITASAIQGWAFDPAAGSHGAGPVAIRVDVDGKPVAVYVAAVERADLLAAVGSTAHGFSVPLPIAGIGPGAHRYDVWAFNAETGTGVLIGSKTFTVSVPPVGNLELATADEISGWVADEDSRSSPAKVVLLVDGQVARTLTTNWQRSDLSAFGSGAFGFITLTPALGAGVHTVALYGVDDKTGAPVLLSVRKLVVPAHEDRMPVGVAETVTPTVVSGWAVDPDSSGPAVVVVTVDGTVVGAAYASGNRPDLAGFVGSTGHGFSMTLGASTVPVGTHTMKVEVLDAQTGAVITLSTRSVTVSAPPPPPTDTGGGDGQMTDPVDGSGGDGTLAG